MRIPIREQLALLVLITSLFALGLLALATVSPSDTWILLRGTS